MLRIYGLVKAAADEIRSKQSGPRFFECMTYRWKEHVGPGDDFDRGYRSISEAQPWFANDQLKRLESLLGPQVRERIMGEVEVEIAQAFQFAESSSFPAEEELYTDVFGEAAQWTAS